MYNDWLRAQPEELNRDIEPLIIAEAQGRIHARSSESPWVDLDLISSFVQLQIRIKQERNL